MIAQRVLTALEFDHRTSQDNASRSVTQICVDERHRSADRSVPDIRQVRLNQTIESALHQVRMSSDYEGPASWTQEDLEETMTDSATWTSMLGSIEADSRLDETLSCESALHLRRLCLVRLGLIWINTCLQIAARISRLSLCISRGPIPQIAFSNYTTWQKDKPFLKCGP